MPRNEADTRAQWIDPQLNRAGWTRSRVTREHYYRPDWQYTAGRVVLRGGRARREKPRIMDYLLRYTDGFPIAVVEAKAKFHILRPKSGILPDWIYHYIHRKKFQREVQQRFRDTAGQQCAPQDSPETHEIPVPYPNDPEKSLNMQRLLVHRFNAVREEVVRMKRSVEGDLKKPDVLEQSILAAAFRGEV